MNPDEWEYFTEGGANIIFRYSGSDEFYKNKILRVPKKTYNSKFNLISFLPSYHDFICGHLQMIGSIGMLCSIKFEKINGFLEILNKKSYEQRPEHRRLKYQIDTSAPFVFLMPDLLFESICCEIKPKWSGLKHHHINDDMCSCRYCLAQIQKERRIDSSNGYCPKLLFSNDKIKIFNGITGLFVRPSNQLKIFINSRIVENGQLEEYKSTILPIIAYIVEFDDSFNFFLKFQFDLLANIILESINTEDFSLEMYKTDLTKLSEGLFNSISDIPSYLRILMAMSVRDSSFIISIKSFSSYKDWKKVAIAGVDHYYKINVIDLDIKPIEKLNSYIQDIKLHG